MPMRIVFGISSMFIITLCPSLPFSNQWLNRTADSLRRSEVKIRPDCKDDIRTAGISVPVKAERFTYYPLDTVPLDGTANPAVDADAYTTPVQVVCTADEGEPPAVQPFPLLVNFVELPALADLEVLGKRQVVFQKENYTASCLRPLALRAFRIARPARVFIRARKPWVRLRLMLLG